MSDQWTWKQPKDQAELLSRLADARDLNVPERERENLCACALTELRQQELVADRLRVSWREDVATERARAEQAEAALSTAQQERERSLALWHRRLQLLRVEADAAIAARDAAQAALISLYTFAVHKADCPRFPGPFGPCTCGLSRFLDEGEPLAAALAQTAGTPDNYQNQQDGPLRVGAQTAGKGE